MKNVTVLGIDLAKDVFQLHGVNEHGKKVLGKKLSRAALPNFIANLPPCKIAMEACGSANYWSRKFMSDPALICWTKKYIFIPIRFLATSAIFLLIFYLLIKLI